MLRDCISDVVINVTLMIKYDYLQFDCIELGPHNVEESGPNLEPTKTSLSFMQPRPPTPSISSKLTLNLVLPYTSELSTKEANLSQFYFLGLV
jgi:hypothetical protein